LLNPISKNRIRLKHNWVKEFVPKPISAFSYFEFDIKYVYVSGKKSNAQVLTVIDVYSRWIIAQSIAWDMTHKSVISLFDEMFNEFNLPERFFIRCDNGSQFIAHTTQEYFKNKNITQEFTRPATPEQNAHIESYHSIMESVICQKYETKDIKELKEIMLRFKKFYNFDRIHSGSGKTSPYKFLLREGFDMKSFLKEK
jgi:putative transposase